MCPQRNNAGLAHREFEGKEGRRWSLASETRSWRSANSHRHDAHVLHLRREDDRVCALCQVLLEPSRLPG